MRVPLLCLAVLVALLVATVDAKSAAEWEGRRIYQLLTDRFATGTGTTTACSDMNNYCGGTFAGITNHLDYITGMGFNAIWISPVPVNYKGGYHGYWAIDFTKINPHFGTEADLKAFVNAAHAKGVWVMMDIVVNHVGPVGTDYSNVVPFNSSAHYHTDCQVTQYVCHTKEIHDCRLANLPDLNQTVPFVKASLQKYVHWLVSEFGFDGARADTVMYIEKTYWASLQAASGIFIAGEVWSSFNCNLDYTQSGIDATLNYPLYYTLRSVYKSGGSMRQLGAAWRSMKEYAHPNWEVNFLDNQDNNRFLNSSSNHAAYRAAYAHMFFTNGIPVVYYGTEQYFSGGIEGNYCRESLWQTGFDTTTRMYKFFANLSAAHEQLKPWKHDVHERWMDSSIYCFVRDPMLICTTNGNTAQTRTIPNLQWFSNKTVCNWMDKSAPCFTGADTMTITVPAGGEPLLLYIKP